MRRMNLRRITFAVNVPSFAQIRIGWISLWVVLLLWINTGYSAAQATPMVSCRLSSASVGVGGPFELFLEVQNVQNFYGYELSLLYDPSLVELVDADPDREGVNAQLGDFLQPDFLVLNEIYEPGEFLLNLTQVDPTLARSGNGLLAQILVAGRSEDMATFTLADVALYSASGDEIPHQLQNCALQVGNVAPPTVTPTEATATPVPATAVVATATPAPPMAAMATGAPSTSTPVLQLWLPLVVAQAIPVQDDLAQRDPASNVVEESTATTIPQPEVITSTPVPLLVAALPLLATPTPSVSWAALPPSGLAPNHQSLSTAYTLAEQNLMVLLLCLSAAGVAGIGFLGLIASVLLIGLRSL